MGRRSTSTTKSGKYMNPADQARKEARRRELKKNKKTRMAVRAAVLKSKDPESILKEMEKVDEMEYQADGKPFLHEKVLQEKRKKLQETLDRVMKMYEKDTPEQWVELKKTVTEYEKKRAQLEQYALAVRIASEVKPCEIPLPDGMGASDYMNLMTTSDIPLPVVATDQQAQQLIQPKQSILKKAPPPREKRKEPPGPPPGLPPNLSGSEDSDSGEDDDGKTQTGQVLNDGTDRDDEPDAQKTNKKLKKVTVGPSLETGEQYNPEVGLDDDEDDHDKGSSRVRFSEETTEAEKDTRTKYKQLARKMAAAEGNEEDYNIDDDDETESSSKPRMIPPGSGITVGIRPPPLRTGLPLGIIAQGGAVPTRLLRPPPPPTGLPPGMRPGMRVPPPPPGFPPRMLRPGMGIPHPGALAAHQSAAMQQPMINPGAVLSAPPSINVRPQRIPEMTADIPDVSATAVGAPAASTLTGGTTIEAKPQLRNMTAEVTKMVPTAVKIRKKSQPTPTMPMSTGPKKHHIPQATLLTPGLAGAAGPSKKPHKDDAYDQFMKEMESIL